jgi:hypothetical protein
MSVDIDIENIDIIVTNGLEKFEENYSFSPYRIAIVYNEIAKLSGLKEMRTQMMYNYARNGLIVKGEKNRLEFSKKEVSEFLVKFIVRKFANV